jgi:uncharacterized membrane protein
MKKILTILIMFLFLSCSTTKKVQEVKEEVKNEVVADSQEKKDVITDVVTNVVVENKDEEFVYEPVNENNPMIIDGIVYNNTKIKKVKKNTKAVSKEVSKKKDTQEIIKKAIAKTTQVTANKNLDKEVKPSSFIWLWWIFIIVVLGVSYKVYKYFT